MSPLILLAIALLLVVACGIFVAAEISLLTVDRATVEKAADAGDASAARLLRGLKSLSTQLSGAQLGITITNLAIGFLAEPAISQLIEGPLTAIGIPEGAVPGIAVVLGLLIATALTMIFGEMVPKNLAISEPMRSARIVVPVQMGFTSLMGWAIAAFNGTANFVLHRIGVEPTEELASARSSIELASLVRRSAQQGSLNQGTASLVEKSLRFSDHLARDVLTPRVRVTVVDVDAPAAEVVTLSRRTGHSRFPVVESGRLDNIVGVVNITDAVAVPRPERWDVKVRDIMVEPVLVPDSLPLDPLMRTLRDGELPMAIVIDEYGGSAGIISIEDLIEEIVGEVWDEHDPDRLPESAEDDGSWIVSALLRPDEARDLTALPIPDLEDTETLSGVMAASLGRIPAIDDETVVNGVRMRVVGTDGRRVERIQLWLAAPQEGGEGG